MLFRTVFWLPINGVLCLQTGLAFVGVASLFGTSSNANAKNPLLGDVLVIAAQVASRCFMLCPSLLHVLYVCWQVIVAVQMVVEEKLVVKYDVPALQVCASLSSL